MSKKQTDFLVVVGILIFAAAISLALRLKPLAGSFLYILTPSFYLIFRQKKNYKKILWGTLIFGFLLGFFFDFIAEYNGAWHTIGLVIPYRIFGVEPVDNVLGYAFMVFFIVVFYEHFLHQERHRRLSKGKSTALLMSVLMVAVVVMLFTLRPASLKISHMYLKGGLAAIIFPIIYGFNHPKMLGKFALLTLFFIPVWLLAEFVVVTNSGWYFPGQYIGWVNIFGVYFPFEELFFWIGWYSATMVAFYEHYIDDDQ